MMPKQWMLIAGIFIFVGFAVVGTVFGKTQLLPLMGVGVVLIALGQFVKVEDRNDNDAS